MVKSKSKFKEIISLFLSAVIILSISAFAATPTTVGAVSKRTRVIRKLTGKKWYMSKMYLDGEPSTPGSGAKYGGTYIKFKKNMKFDCNIGITYRCYGKYTVNKKGKVTLHIKKQCYDNRKNFKTKLHISKSFKTISFKVPYLDGSFKFYFKR